MDFNNDTGNLSNVAAISSSGSTITFDGTGGLALPAGSIAQRPTLTNGLIRLNNETGYVEAASGNAWVNITPPITSGIYSTNVSSWTLVSGTSYYANIVHNLATENIVVSLWDTATNTLVQAGSLVIIDSNTVKVTVTGNTRTIRVVVVSSASYTPISTWTLLSGTRYYYDLVHNFGTMNIAVSLWNASNILVQPDSIRALNSNTIRITVIGNSNVLRPVVIANGASIVNGAGGSLTIQDETTVIPNNPHTTLNFTGPGVTVTDAGGGVANINVAGPIKTYTYYPVSLDSPNNANWAINALAATVSDPTNNALIVRQFSNTTEQGVGFNLTIPSGATNISFKCKARAQTAPGSTAVVQPKIYIRSIPNNAAIGAWSTAYNFTNISIPTNAYYQYSSQTFTLSALSLSLLGLYQCELTRASTVSGGTQLASNWYLIELTIEFS